MLATVSPRLNYAAVASVSRLAASQDCPISYHQATTVGTQLVRLSRLDSFGLLDANSAHILRSAPQNPNPSGI